MNLRPIFYDTETTGIKTDKDFIIEIAGYDPVNDISFESFINPGCSIPKEATAIHHITDEMVANAPSFKDVALSWKEFCSGNVVLIAHNNDTFDQLILTSEFKRHNVEMPTWDFLDSLKWARRYRSDLPRHSLQYLREIYNIPSNNAHRALDDVKVLYKVFGCMTDDLNIDEIVRLMKQPRLLQHMPFGKYQGTPLKEVPSNYIQWLGTSGFFDKQENQQLKESFVNLGKL